MGSIINICTAGLPTKELDATSLLEGPELLRGTKKSTKYYAGRTDGQINMTNLTVTLRNLVNEQKTKKKTGPSIYFINLPCNSLLWDRVNTQDFL
jgi:hypothetical protein